MNGYNLIISDHPSNKTLSAVCLFYKKSHDINVISTSYLDENIKVMLLVYRSMSK